MKSVRFLLPAMLALSNVAWGQSAEAVAVGQHAEAIAKAELQNKRQATNPQSVVDAFGTAIKQRWSYYRANGVDFDAELARLRQRVSDDAMTLDATERELQRILMLGIDGHANVANVSYPRGSLPLSLGPVGMRLAAIKPDYSELLNPDTPYVESIAGVDIEQWLQLAARYVAKGSPQLVRSRGARMLARDFRFLQEAGGFPRKDSVEVVLVSADNTRRNVMQLEVTTQGAAKSLGNVEKVEQSLGPSRWLDDGQTGYLRIAKMDDAAAGEVDTWMRTFRNAKALVVDIRNNGGGSRDALLRLYSYLAAPNDPPRVINAAVYRNFVDYKQDHLTSRFMYRENDPHWSTAERRAIAQFKKSFVPQWAPPAGEFSDWHYLALSRDKTPGTYHFNKPVVVLSNERIFSAADIFMAGMHSLPNVTLLGVPSGGGSALVVSVPLQDGASVLKIGSMISYQADGRLFDGVGVPVDVRVEPIPEFYLAYGKAQDNMLAAAQQFLLGQQTARH
jgi:hypothetical protein